MSNSNLKIIMKTKLIIICCALLFISCLPDEEEAQIGFTFTIANQSGVEHENVKITIGGIENGEFVGTDSYIFPKIMVLSNDWPDTSGNQSQSFAIDNNRWKPNLSLVKEISEKAYFTVQLDGKDPILLYDNFDFGQGELVSIEIPENNIINKNLGLLYITIKTDTIFGDLPIFN
jgi:hypothetical protein